MAALIQRGGRYETAVCPDPGLYPAAGRLRRSGGGERLRLGQRASSSSSSASASVQTQPEETAASAPFTLAACPAYSFHPVLAENLRQPDPWPP